MLEKFFKFSVISLLVCLSLFSKEPVDQWDGNHYEQHSDLQYKWAMFSLKRMRLNDSARVLDIGCGDGRITVEIAKMVRNGRVVGIDISNSMLAKAFENQTKRDLKNLSFLPMDATSLNFQNEFDFVTSFCCFHWIKDQLAALKSIEKALAPQGIVYLYFAPDHGRERFDHAIDFVANSSKWKDYFDDFTNSFVLVTPKHFMDLLDQTSLMFQRMEIIIVDEIFKDRKEFIGWMTGWMPHLKKLPVNLREDFLNEIIDLYLQKSPVDSEGNIHYIDYFIEVEASKS